MPKAAFATANIPRWGRLKSPSRSCRARGSAAPRSMPRRTALLLDTAQINRGAAAKRWPLTALPASPKRPARRIGRAINAMARRSESLRHRAPGSRRPMADINAVAGVVASSIRHSSIPGTTTRNEYGPSQLMSTSLCTVVAAAGAKYRAQLSAGGASAMNVHCPAGEQCHTVR